MIGVVDLWLVQWLRCRVRAEMVMLSEQDRLTDLYSARAFSKRLREEISRSRRHSRTFSLTCLSFSSAEAGREGSKEVLSTAEIRAAALLLTGFIREEDCLSRIGGTEFVLLLPETEIDAANRLAERLVECFQTRPILLKGGRTCRMQVLASTVSYPSDGEDVEELIALGEDRVRFGNPFLATAMQ